METIWKIRVEASVMDVHVYAPASHEPSAVVVLMYPRSGMDGFPQRVAVELSGHGYAVAVPDITHRISAEVPIRDRKRLLTDAGVVEDVGALLSHLEATGLQDVPCFISGHCMGGRNALLAASAYAFAGAVCFYGGEMFEGWGSNETPFSRLRYITSPVLGFFGAKDKNPSPADVARIHEELSRWNVEHRFVTYEDVGHAFQQNAGRSAEERHATDDSTSQMLAFLRAQTAAARPSTSPQTARLGAP